MRNGQRHTYPGDGRADAHDGDFTLGVGVNKRTSVESMNTRGGRRLLLANQSQRDQVFFASLGIHMKLGSSAWKLK